MKKPPGGDEQLKRMTFGDKLMGGETTPPPKEFVDLIDAGKMRVELVKGNYLLPIIKCVFGFQFIRVLKQFQLKNTNFSE